eukprot:12358099-Ditylum_brightwellii.AAC.1
MEEEKEVEVHEENNISEVFPSDTWKGSKVQEEGGQESKDNLEGDKNDDAGMEVYGKDSKEMSDSSEGSKCDILNVSPSTVKIKVGGTQKDSLKVSKYDDLEVSQSKGHAKGGKQKAKQGVAKGGVYTGYILSDSSGK